jgi:hypothetical protein
VRNVAIFVVALTVQLCALRWALGADVSGATILAKICDLEAGK